MYTHMYNPLKTILFTSHSYRHIIKSNRTMNKNKNALLLHKERQAVLAHPAITF